MDEAVEQFVAFTGATPEQARQYLRVSDGDAQQAIQLYFDTGGIDLESQDSAAASTLPVSQGNRETSSPSANSERTGRQRLLSLDSDDELVPDVDDKDDEVVITGERPVNPSARTAASTATGRTHHNGGMTDDEAMARRLQEELYAGTERSVGFDADGVRAPIQRHTETLVGPGADYGPDDMRAAVEAQMATRRRLQGGRAGIFNQRPTPPSVWDSPQADPTARRQHLAQATGGASEASSKASALAEMYRPPHELMSHLPWDDAREQGKESEKWILVNVQDSAVFDCQLLNRDIWKHHEIKGTVKENFIFMQYEKMDPRGSQYVQYYFQDRDNQDAYPHIAIVDPRTGEQVKVWSGPPVPKPMEFLMQLHEFLDRYSLKANARNPVATRKLEKKKTVDVDRMTEEEMLEMALQNSMDPNSLLNKKSQGFDPDTLTKAARQGTPISVKDSPRSMDLAGEKPTNGEGSSTTQLKTPFSLITSSRPHEEPANGPSTTRIQFRYPDGRIIRRFHLFDPVRRIYEWLKAEPLEGKVGMEFQLTCMGTNLMEQVELSIEEAGLKNQTVMVEFVEE